jgi:acylphosphatase
MGKTVRVHVRIEGLVQGVFFRSNIKRRALTLGVKGWVKNLWDGSVEAVFEGKEEDVERLLEFCHTGPPGARVENVDVTYSSYKGEFQDFVIRY